MQNNSTGGFGFGNIPEVTKNLLIINVLMLVATVAVGNALSIDLRDYLGLHLWLADDFNPIQIITNMFMHGDFTHLFFNMFVLWMFGSILESHVWGSKKFLVYYLLTGIGAGILYSVTAYWEILPTLSLLDAFMDSPSVATLNELSNAHKFWVDPNYNYDMYTAFTDFKQNAALYEANPSNAVAMNSAVTFVSDYKDYYLNLRTAVGASGAVYGLLLAFGMFFPNELLYIYFLIPVKAKYVVIVLAAAELYFGVVNSPGDNIAHFAHLGGMLFGFILIKFFGFDFNNKNGKLS
jgi:membrane associated rhomboid family serine protease